jgi:para-nitrobenzyl esterase
VCVDQTGASNDYCGPCLVASSKNSVVVVTINYRLNVFGFLGGSEVKDSTRGHGAGNFGIQDQRMAIAWTKAHIAAFGGDGEDITIFGESAGGNSVINHLAQPASFGLYTKAIVESGAYNLGAGTMEEAETNYKKLLASSSCSSLSCLKALKQKVRESFNLPLS